ncbi:MAG: hypothetical protein HY664_01000 [Chloroflexi bacterium]|nr:hypothetical protein [Chloroflexota bacterium]
MDRSKVGGIIICVVSLVAAGLFIWGVAVRNYWAIAIPVLIGFLGILALTFWIGWTIAVTEAEVPASQIPEETASQESTSPSS